MGIDSICAELDRGLAGRDSATVVVASALEYTPGEPIRVRVRKRGHRYDLDDDGRAVALVGCPRGWLEVADDVVAESGLNVNRAGVVLVSVVEGRDLAVIVVKVAEASRAVYAELLEHRDSVAR